MIEFSRFIRLVSSLLIDEISSNFILDDFFGVCVRRKELRKYSRWIKAVDRCCRSIIESVKGSIVLNGDERKMYQRLNYLFERIMMMNNYLEDNDDLWE